MCYFLFFSSCTSLIVFSFPITKSIIVISYWWMQLHAFCSFVGGFCWCIPVYDLYISGKPIWTACLNKNLDLWKLLVYTVHKNLELVGYFLNFDREKCLLKESLLQIFALHIQVVSFYSCDDSFFFNGPRFWNFCWKGIV